MAKTNRGGRRYGGGGEPVIQATYSLVSAREGNEREVDATLTVMRDTYNEFGVTVNDDLVVAKMLGKSSTLAYYDEDNIGVNEAYFNMEKMEHVMKRSVSTGFHPNTGNKTGLEATIAHEVGHLLTGKIADKLGLNGLSNIDQTATMIVNEAKKMTGARGVVVMASKISRYATTSNAETVAEAYGDWYCNGENAKTESKAIVKVMKKYLK